MKPIFLILTAVLFAVQPSKETKDSAIANILSLGKAAENSRLAEKITKNAETTANRQNAYKTAAKALEVYIPQWEPEQTVRNLKAHFRLATYLDFADETQEALKEYEICRHHPRLNDSGALWNNEPIAPLVDTRISTLLGIPPSPPDNNQRTPARDSSAMSHSLAKEPDDHNVNSHSEGSVPAPKQPI
jgi:hypothetical protein